jgi:hypothetical protein
LINPVEGHAKKSLENSLEPLKITLRAQLLPQKEGFIEISITDNIHPMKMEEIDGAFLMAGGLNAQQFRLREWEGEMSGRKDAEGNNVFYIHVPRAYPYEERKRL